MSDVLGGFCMSLLTKLGRYIQQGVILVLYARMLLDTALKHWLLTDFFSQKLITVEAHHVRVCDHGLALTCCRQGCRKSCYRNLPTEIPSRMLCVVIAVILPNVKIGSF